MASSGSDVPAARAAVARNDLTEARDGVARLRNFLLQLDDQSAAWAQLEIDGVLTKLSSAMSALDVSAGPDGARPQQSGSSCGNKRKQSSSKSRSQRPSDKKITATLEDGHVWRKYGQKEIQDSPYPRSYYRCTHKSDQGCSAKRQVQRCETDTSKYVVTYYGEHTCRDPSTIPLIDHAAGALAELDHANNLISFGPSSTNNDANAAAAASNGAGASSSQYLQAMGGSAAADQLSTSWCTSDDVFSSSAGSFMQVDELIGAVVGSAGVTSAAPDRGVASGGRVTASFPPSPNSLGFVVGSLGSIGGGEDDDMFRLDP
ncbi:transcription factor WRKY45-2-like isoform X2 [Miscanthus floridulus]|uniref:transcription factor WRKY45-2-like isoform X2 n=1 Tax=Miscanthus floridulus TaxID=154761 RepID=UPI0034591127